jgi:transcriptional regulator with XRE-family HTH domain
MTDTETASAPSGNSGWYSAKSATFGDRMAGARDAMNMTQSELSKRIGVKLKTIRSWEDDLEEPRANKLQMLAGLLNVSMMWLLNGEGDGLGEPSDEMALAPEVTELLTELRNLKSQMAQTANRLGLLEKRLRTVLKDPN